MLETQEAAAWGAVDRFFDKLAEGKNPMTDTTKAGLPDRMNAFCTIDGRPLRWQSPDGLMHAVEGCHISRPGDGILLWPVCEQGDVPANAAHKGGDAVTCPKCRATLDAKDAEIARLRKRMNEDGDAITQAVLAEIREILNAAGVPEATWVDDHVRNAVTEIAQLREDLTATKENRDLYLRQAQWREEDMRDAEARLAEVVQLIREMSHERYDGGNSAPEMVRWDTCLDRLEVFATKGGSDA